MVADDCNSCFFSLFVFYILQPVYPIFTAFFFPSLSSSSSLYVISGCIPLSWTFKDTVPTTWIKPSVHSSQCGGITPSLFFKLLSYSLCCSITFSCVQPQWRVWIYWYRMVLIMLYDASEIITGWCAYCRGLLFYLTNIIFLFPAVLPTPIWTGAE